MNVKLYIYAILLLAEGMIYSGSLKAQEKAATAIITGVVVDRKNQPVADVKVSIQENRGEVFTGKNGQFEINSKNLNDLLVFEKQGYARVEVIAMDVKSKVTLETTPIEMGVDDDVNIPFGIRKKREITGAISTLDMDQMPHNLTGSISNYLPGRIPGLFVSAPGSVPGNNDGPLLSRGLDAYPVYGGTHVTTPLLILDGAERPFTELDAQEIESITVLKDAAATAWYGVRGGNGVILVTTKRGNANKSEISFDASNIWKVPESMPRVVDSYSMATLINQALANEGAAPRFSQVQLDGYNAGTDPYLYPNNNLPNQLLKNATLSQRFVLNASGGNKIAKYFVLGSYYNQGGLFAGTQQKEFDSNMNYKRYNLRSNVNVNVTKDLDVGMDISLRHEDLHQPGAGWSTVYNNIMETPAFAYPLINPDGSYGGSSTFQQNPLAQLQKTGFQSTVTRNLSFNFSAKYKMEAILKGLSANAYSSYYIYQDFTSGQTQNFQVYSYDPTQPAEAQYKRYGVESRLAYRTGTLANYTRNVEFWGGFDYDRNFGDHKLNLSTKYQQGMRSIPLTFPIKFQGVSLRASYGYKNKYLAEFVSSYNGTEAFMKGKRFGFFPAVSAGWVLSEEDFLKGSSSINYLKLRASVGTVGYKGMDEFLTSDRLFPYEDRYFAYGGGFPFGTGFTAAPRTPALSYPNKNITWEKVQRKNVGIDMHLLNCSLAITADVFQEDRTQILTGSLLPAIIGRSPFPMNDGAAQYKGAEGSVNYSKKVGDVSLSVYGNYTFSKNKVIAMNEDAGIPDYQKQVGRSLNAVYQYQALGLFQSAEEIKNSPKQQFGLYVVPGDIKYRDINDDGNINSLDAVRSDDMLNFPTSFIGFGGSLKYAGFDFSFHFYGIMGGTESTAGIINRGNNSNGYITQYSSEAWTTSNTNARFPRLSISERANNTQASTFWRRSSDELTLKNVELGYTLPIAVSKAVHLNSCRFYLSGMDLLRFDHRDGIYSSGIGDLPWMQSYSMGVNIKF
ncbi:MAG: SusC/RagA family TonB-linked outer membrane protein [Lentimicrobiaceae bacterium]|nr:SusC/RagA family TonB-linked outer membrane protein [Lentimicrobiaceae bacterium]